MSFLETTRKSRRKKTTPVDTTPVDTTPVEQSRTKTRRKKTTPDTEFKTMDDSPFADPFEQTYGTLFSKKFSGTYGGLVKTLNPKTVEFSDDKVIAVARYDDGHKTRYIAIVKIPEQYVEEDGKWKWPRKNHMLEQKNADIRCKNIAFYMSTGTSNKNKIDFQQMPGIWFPFTRVSTKDGWMHKITYLWKDHIQVPFFPNLLPSTFGRSVTKKLLTYQKSEKINFFSTISNFFDRFTHWWQVQISSALPADPTIAATLILPDLAMVRAYSLGHDFDPKKTKFVENPNIIKRYIVPKVETILRSPEEVNNFLEKHGALCELVDRPRPREGG